MNSLRAGPAADSRLDTAILASIPLGLYVLDQEWRFLYLNPTAERFFEQLCGYNRAQLLGKTIWEQCPEVADSTFSKEYHQAVTEQRTFELETFYPQLNRWFLVLAPAAQDIRCIYFQDVTERTRLERELRLRVDQLAETDRGKDQFLIHLAHEIRNALAPVRNALHLLGAHGKNGAAVDEAHALAEREILYLTHLMEDLLRVARLAHAAQQPRKEQFDLAVVIARALQGAITSAQGRGRSFNVNLPPEPLWLEGDPREIEEVLTQLLGNATHYTQPDGSIWLSAGREGDTVVLRLRDNGVGIAPELLPKVFNLFMRAERALDRTQGGLGVGLTLVRKLVQRHGGTVEAASAGPGHGSEFTVRLPAVASRSAHGKRDTAANDPGRPGLRVLVVDNSPEAVHSLAILLTEWGYEVREAYDGATGLKEAEAWRPNVVVLDIGMPGMDGYEVARRLRLLDNPDGMVLVALTGFGEDEDRRRAREAGFDFHLLKPVSPEELRELLAAIDSTVRSPAATVTG